MSHRLSMDDPDMASLDVACRRAMDLHLTGRLDLAGELYDSILQEQPRNALANHGLGMLQVQLLRPAQGLPYLLTALEESPESSDFWLAYLEALLSAGLLGDATHALGLGREHGLAGNAVVDFARRLDEHHAAAAERGKLDALAALSAFADLHPDDADAQRDLGTAMLKLMRLDEAETYLRRALAIAPSFAAHYDLGKTYGHQGRMREAEASIRSAIALNPHDHIAHDELCYLLWLRGENAAAQAALRRSIALEPDNAQAFSSLLGLLSQDPSLDADSLFREHRRFGRQFEAGLLASRAQHTNTADPDRCLRIGIVSGDFYKHAIPSFIEPVLTHLARSPGIELHAYYTNARVDTVTQRLRGHLRHWNAVHPLSDHALAEKIRADRIDILIDLSGHTALNRLRVFAEKPAPVQASWMGYPGTTGLSAMDYYIADRHFLPPGQFDRHFTEKIAYLSAGAPFQPHATSPTVNSLPALATGSLNFGSFNRVNKINASTIDLWSTLLRALPSARLIIGGMPPEEGASRRLIDQFTAHGVDPARSSFYPRCDMDSYLALYHQVDICLDTYPYAGGTTTHHGLWMGVPTLTVAGATPAARQGAASLLHAGLEGFVATSFADFVAKGCHWADHLEELSVVRDGLRERMRQSPSAQPGFIAAEVERAWRHMWREWCAGKPPETFEVTPGGCVPLAAPRAPHTSRKLARAERRRTKSRSAAPPQDDVLSGLLRDGRWPEALALARSMTERHPEHGSGWKTLGALLWAEGRTEAAVDAMQMSVELSPHDAEAHANLGTTFAKLHRFEEAETHLLWALDIDPEYAAAHYRLGMCYDLQGRLAEAEASMRRGIALRTGALTADDQQAYSNLLFALSHSPAIDADTLFAEHCRVGECFEAGLREGWPRHPNNRDPDRRLQLGLVSGDLCHHSVANFIEPVLAQLAHAADFTLHIYSTRDHDPADRTAERLRAYGDHWRCVAAVSDSDFAQRITDDGIDILIDLSGHTRLNRLCTFARKPAPIQVSWMGYPGTTGLQAMDYYLTDAHWLPPGRFDQHFTEELVYLPANAPFQPHASAPAVNSLPALDLGSLTFGSFNRSGKFSMGTLRLWSELLRALPTARLLMAGLVPGADHSKIIEQFGALGIEPERIECHPRCEMDRYLALHHRVDVCLDTTPYTGGTTTHHALWMGVPTLTLAGLTPPARQGAALMGHLGLDAFIASDNADFVAKGVYWADHLPALSMLRADLRERCRQSPLQQPALIVAGLTRALRHMWKRWCAGLPPESFDSTATPAESSVASAEEDAVLCALVQQRRFPEALNSARTMTERFPEHGLGWKIFGAMLAAEARTEDAIAAMQRSAQLLPQDAEAHSNLALELLRAARLDEAETAFRRALEIDPRLAAAHYRLGMMQGAQGRYPDAEASLRRVIALQSGSAIGGDSLLVNSYLLHLMSHDASMDAEALFAEHVRVGNDFESAFRDCWPDHANSREAERTLRVGFVSGDFCDHAVAHYLEPVLAWLSGRPGLELHAYYNHSSEDAVTQRMRADFQHWHAVAALADEELAQKIIEDRIDILIDLSGHTLHHRLRTFARKPAPIQVSWMGYPGTTGLQAIDYYLTDAHWLPPGQFDRHFTEKLVYLPANAPFRPHASAPAVNALPALDSGSLTFGSFNRSGKLTASTLRLWSELLLALPDSRLLLAGLAPDRNHSEIIEQFTALGIEPERIECHTRCERDRYLTLHHRVDLCLDTTPYTGGTTTQHALWMGVPTLTLAGSTPPSRQGAALMGHLGLDAFIAADSADFVAKGLYWSRQLAALSTLRAELRERCRQSPLQQPELIVAALDLTLRHIWRRWCKGLPPESFDSTATPTELPVASIDEDTALLASSPTRRKSTTHLAREHDNAVMAVLQKPEGLIAGLVMARSNTQRFPYHGPAWKTLGAVLWWQGSSKDAVVAMQTAARLSPEDAETHRNLGLVLLKLERFDEAEPHLGRALEVDQSYAAAHYGLGRCYESQGRYSEAQRSIRRGLALRSEFLTTEDVHSYSHLMFAMSHDETVSAGALFTEHCRAGEALEAGLRDGWLSHTNSREPDRCLHVGFVSGDLCNHSVANFFEPVLAELMNVANLELHLYYTNTSADPVTERIRSYGTHWACVAALSDVKLVQKIREDGIDILIDLSGHTSMNRLWTFARKPAPIQVSWMGYPGTTGLLAMDYYLTDAHWLPPGRFDQHFTEKLVYLPANAPFRPHASAPAVNSLPALGLGSLTFGSFNRSGKFSMGTLRLWSELLHALPDSRLLLGGLAPGRNHSEIIEQFTALGIEPERIECHPRCEMDRYLALHHRVDLCLDTTPYTGGTTTHHALWMGVPTLTLAGSTPPGRQGAALMGHLGLDAFIAADSADFVAKGLYWAGHLAALSTLRAELRERCGQSPLQQTEVIVAGLARALRHMWKRWCAGLPPQSFDHSAEFEL